MCMAKVCMGCEFGLAHNPDCVSRGKYESLDEYRARILNISVREVGILVGQFFRETVLYHPGQPEQQHDSEAD